MSSGLHGHGAGESQSGAPVQGAGVLDDGPPSASRSGGQGGGAGENGDGSRRPPILLRGGRRGSSPTRMGSSERAGATQGGLHAAQGGAGGHTPMPPGPPVRRPSSGKRDSLREDDERGKEDKAVKNWYAFYTEYALERRLSNGGLGRKVYFNCGGLIVQSYERYIRRYRGTMLSDMLCCEGGELTRKNFVFLDRHPFACIEILNAYRDGFVTQPPHVAVEVWQAELYAFEFHNCTNGPIEGLDKVLGVGNEPDMAELVVAAEGKPAKGTVRLQLWKLFEDPSSSWIAWCVSTLSFLFVVISVSIVLVQTVPEIENDLAVTRVLDRLDIAIVIYFTIEYLLRILLTTERVKFFLRPLNLVDLVSILPSYIELIIGGGNGALGLMRVLRVLRVFKLARHSAGLQVLAETAISARNELFQVFFCFSILAILFAAIVYYTEEQSMESREFVSIPHAMWWSVITLCTIGYGDMVPATGLGQAVGAMACVSGVVMVALPISVISQTFQAKFQEHTERQKMIERHNEQIRAEKERQKVERQGSSEPRPRTSMAYLNHFRNTFSSISGRTQSSELGRLSSEKHWNRGNRPDSARHSSIDGRISISSGPGNRTQCQKSNRGIGTQSPALSSSVAPTRMSPALSSSVAPTRMPSGEALSLASGDESTAAGGNAVSSRLAVTSSANFFKTI